MDHYTFFESLKQHCAQQTGCETCCMRLFCYTPPVEKTTYMIHEVTEYLALAQNGTVADTPSDRHISDRMQKCPLELDMSNALGNREGLKDYTVIVETDTANPFVLAKITAHGSVYLTDLEAECVDLSSLGPLRVRTE